LEKFQTRPMQTVDTSDEEKVIPWAEGNGLWHIVFQLVNNLTGVDIITFFVQNPYAIDSVEGLAVRIGRRAEELEPVLEELCKEELLNRIDLGDIVVYELSEDPKRRQTLQQYVIWLNEGYHWTRMVMDQ
jgi:hypothetical protein